MTAAPPGDLTARVFRALYAGYDLYAIGGTHIADDELTPTGGIYVSPCPRTVGPRDRRKRIPRAPGASP